MNTIKSLVLSLGLILGVVNSTMAQNVVVASTSGANQANVISDTNTVVTKITVLSATANVVRFYDYWTNAPWAFGTYSNQAYTQWLSVAFTNNVTYTSSLGRTMTNSYIGVSNYPAIVAAGTNTYPVIGSVSVQAGVPYTITLNWNVSRQLWAIGTNAATISAEYYNGL